MVEQWLADRTRCFDPSGIRRVFELASKLENPINLSIGQPDFPTPRPVREAAIQAIGEGKNTYSVSQGIEPLREKLHHRLYEQFGHEDRDVLITCGTSGGLVLALMAVVNPGDEVIVFDPFFVMYDALVKMLGGHPVYVDTYPDFQIDLERLEEAISPKTKAIVFNSPANPTGVVAARDRVEQLARFAAERNILIISDEIYRDFCYDGSHVSPAAFNPNVLVVEGFSKSYAVTGWRIGYAHGPRVLVQEMIKLQQYTFVCAPQPFQWAALAALDTDISEQINSYRKKRDMVYEALSECYEVVKPQGAFYMFPKAPGGTGSDFVAKAIESHGLLIIPGGVFSRQDTHFRISFAAPDEILERGIDILLTMAKEC